MISVPNMDKLVHRPDEQTHWRVVHYKAQSV